MELGGAHETASLVFGLISVVAWAFAEIPQIVSNYKGKSTSGLSLAFLVTWIVGDVLNVVGCWLEPTTLKTQFYMALLFTATTFTLMGQKIYYGIFHHECNNDFSQSLSPDVNTRKQSSIGHTSATQGNDANGISVNNMTIKQGNDAVELSVNNMTIKQSSLAIPCPSSGLSNCSSSNDGDYIYMSARSLSSSPKVLHDTGKTFSSCISEPLLREYAFNKSTPPTKTKNVLCIVPSSILLLLGLRIHFFTQDTTMVHGHVFISAGRKLLQVNYGASSLLNETSDNIGTYLGWGMAVVYMGGRLPQIHLNIKRGHVEGLSPLMFAFALLGNGTYITSILVRSLDWSIIRPNLPWLVDACGCVLLDIFILIQFSFYKYKRQMEPRDVLR